MYFRFLTGLFLLSLMVSCQLSNKALQQKYVSAEQHATLKADLQSTSNLYEARAFGSQYRPLVLSFPKPTVEVIAVGDMMIGTNFPSSDYLPPDSGRHMLANVEELLKSADLTFANQEGVILNTGGEQKYCQDPSVCYIFRSPEYLTRWYLNAGIDVMSLANNHAGDFGDTGRENTMRVLDSIGIHHAGQLAQPYTTFEKDGIRYGFAAFSPNTGTQRITDISAAKKIVMTLDSISDIVIVSFHGGAEGRKYEHVTRGTEFFYGENRGNVYEFAHAVVDAGADLVFGHGPHVARAVEVYKNRFIAYSLGNFATYGRFNLSGPNGLAPIINVKVNQRGDFVSGKIISAKQKGRGVPYLDDRHAAALKIKELTEIDFPENNIFIDREGNIRYLQNTKL